jgi:hypothetical protein
MKKSLLEQLRDEVAGEPAPAGWYTLWKLMEMLGSRRTATLNLAIRKKWPVKKYRTITSDGKSIIATHYHVGKL